MIAKTKKSTMVLTALLALVAAGPAFSTTVSWDGGGGDGLWSTATNWDTGTVPTSTDDVQITLAGTYTVTLDVDTTINSLILGGDSGTQTLSMNARVLTLTDASSSRLTPNGKLTMVGSTLTGTGTMTNAGTMTLTEPLCTVDVGIHNSGGIGLGGNKSTHVFNAPVTVAVGGALWTGTGNGGGSPEFNAGLQNHGAVTLSTGNSGITLIVDGGPFLIGETGALYLGGNEAKTLAAELHNYGTMSLSTSNFTVNKPDAQHINGATGTINATVRLDVIQSGVGSFTNAGDIVTDDQWFRVVGGEFVHQTGGTVTGTGQFRLEAGVIFNGDPYTNQAVLILDADGGGITVNADVLNQRTVSLQGNAVNHVFNGTFVNDGAPNPVGTLSSWTGNGGGNTEFHSGLENHGTIALNTGNSGITLTVDGGPLANYGTFSTGGNTTNKTIVGELHNHGTMNINAGTFTLNKADAQHVNAATGTITTAVRIDVIQSGTSPSFTIAGAIVVNDQWFRVFKGSFTHAGGTVTGTGDLYLEAGATLDGQSYTNQIRVVLDADGGPCAVNADMTNKAGFSLTGNATTHYFNGAFVNDPTGWLATWTGNGGGTVTFAADLPPRLIPVPKLHRPFSFAQRRAERSPCAA